LVADPERRPGIVGHGVEHDSRTDQQVPDLAKREERRRLHLERTGAVGAVEADLFRRGAERGVGCHRLAFGVREPRSVQCGPEPGCQGGVGHGRDVGRQVVVGGSFVADRRGDQHDVARLLPGIEPARRADADAAPHAKLGLELKLGDGGGRADAEAVHADPPVGGIDEEEPPGPGAEHVVRRVQLGMGGEIVLEAGIREHHALGHRPRRPALFAQCVDERGRRIRAREGVLAWHGRDRHGSHSRAGSQQR
jgi:hypothetical protein